MKKRTRVFISGIALAIVLSVQSYAVTPTGWVYQDPPYLFVVDESTWYYWNPSDYVWAYNYKTSQWAQVSPALGNLTSHWDYFGSFPYAYNANGHWVYLDPISLQSNPVWWLNLTTLQWSQLGQ